MLSSERIKRIAYMIEVTVSSLVARQKDSSTQYSNAMNYSNTETVLRLYCKEAIVEFLFSL